MRMVARFAGPALTGVLAAALGCASASAQPAGQPARSGMIPGQENDQTMRFDCISARSGNGAERMEHDVVIDLTQNVVSDTGVIFRNEPGPAGSAYFVQTAAGGARWGFTLPGGEVGAEFRLAADALTYGFFAAGTLQASGGCVRVR